jgi:hypothetical protein
MPNRYLPTFQRNLLSPSSEHTDRKTVTLSHRSVDVRPHVDNPYFEFGRSRPFLEHRKFKLNPFSTKPCLDLNCLFKPMVSGVDNQYPPPSAPAVIIKEVTPRPRTRRTRYCLLPEEWNPRRRNSQWGFSVLYVWGALNTRGPHIPPDIKEGCTEVPKI